jgi:hypothetical membrane protein
MKKTYPIILIMSICVAICYVTFTVIAFTSFPVPYSPANNWLSDLGNPDINPIGARFYNIGIVLADVALTIFFLNLTKMKMRNNHVQNIMTTLTVGFGCIGSLAMLMTAIYPIN